MLQNASHLHQHRQHIRRLYDLNRHRRQRLDNRK
jgi:hypothetical protein